MEVVSGCALPAASLMWQPRASTWVLTFFCKATFHLQAGESPLADDQEPIHVEDSYWDDDPARSLYAATDLTPHKPRTDVILVGSAFAPQAQPVRSLYARLIVGDLDKSIEVFLDRALSPDGMILEGQRFTRMALSYERAAGGGPDSVNPVGLRADARDPYGRLKLPNLQPPGQMGNPGDMAPIGFGPISPGWAPRRSKLGRYAASWTPHTVRSAPLPEDLDRSFFNAAPRDQQLNGLSEDVRIVLENLHPQIPRLVTNLPGVRPRAVLEGRGGHHALAMRVDTLWIDTDRQLCTLTWSGQLALERPDEPGRITLNADNLPATPSTMRQAGTPQERAPSSHTFVGTVDDDEENGPETQTGATAGGATPFGPGRRATFVPGVPGNVVDPKSALPFAAPSAPAREEERRTPAGGGGLPFMNPSATSGGALTPWPQPAPSAPAPRPSSPGWPAAVPTPVPQAAPSQPVTVPPLAPPPQAAPLPPMPPPPVPSPMPSPMPVIQPSGTSDSAWSSGIGRGDQPPARSIGEAAVAAAAPPPPVRVDGNGWAFGASTAAAATGASALLAGKQREERPTMSSTSGAAAVRPAARMDSREILHLIWYQPDSVARICRVPVWRAILDELEQEPSDDALDDPAPTKDPIEIEDRRDIFEILAHGASQDADQLGDELQGAVRPGGKFVPPLLLLAGDLVFPFDERETLKAAIAVATSVAGADEGLKTNLREAREFLSTPDLLCPPQVFDGHTNRIREAFQRARRGVSADYLDTQMERALLEGRHYQRRQVLGMVAIRAYLLSSTGNGARPAPVYLPEDLARKLPLFQRFRTRLIVELYQQEDQYEQHAAALKALVLGRVTLPPDRR
ncbi:DUF2169 family type VI secretion system accessory protein [Chondromyces crocatus]|uniref:DUF2169 domain-containing protein n=1 Tax=Chondromyces crocatus TaxID=52 RepID=A0A0K1ERN1_CHOCO|nr:DUF2169 domain-containing protein [Chondromyces crocatus]AKT43479.1 uncharacterized protein CMC5_077110 [Chondromyces crocatus]